MPQQRRPAPPQGINLIKPAKIWVGKVTGAPDRGGLGGQSSFDHPIHHAQ